MMTTNTIAKNRWRLLTVIGGLLITVTLVFAACGGSSTTSGSTAATATTPPTPTATTSPTPTATTPPTPTATVAFAPSITLRLGPGKYGNKIWLEVLDGAYKLSSGDIAQAGSAIGVETLIFYPNMLIQVAKGGVTLKGKTYPEGTKLVTDASGHLSELK
jgi:ABC-type Fe3+-hydroxamate transport system substrate-binding protein